MSLIHTTLRNPVAGNLIIIVVILTGLLAFQNMHRETFPEFDLDMISISVIYRGATPDEVEESIVTKIEEAIAGIEGIEEINSSSNENVGTIMVKVIDGYDSSKVKEDIEKEVDQIITFPTDSERPVIVQVTRKMHAIYMGLFGDVDMETLKDEAERIKDDLIAGGIITQVEFVGLKEREISIELSEEKLQSYSLTFRQVADVLRRESVNIPGGTIKSDQGEILVRTAERKYTGQELAQLPLITNSSGTTIKLGEVARITDGFADINRFSLLNSRPAVLLRINKTSDQDLIEVCDAVKRYVADNDGKLKKGLRLVTWGDNSKIVRDRLNLLTRNGLQGLILVFLFLVIFMEFKLAIWVAVGIPFSFMGTLIVMQALGLTLNMISMFALIIVLGIVVDDAMVVSESIYSRLKNGNDPETAALEGTTSVFWPVIASVSTTVVAFVPFYFVNGTMGKFMAVLPTAVISVLMFSLVESLFILPSHLSHAASGRRLPLWKLRNVQQFAQKKMDRLIHHHYPKLLAPALTWRYLTVAIAVAMLIATIGLIAGQRIKFDFFPRTDQELLKVSLEFPAGTDAFHTLETLELIREKLDATQEAMKKHRKPGQVFPFIANVHLEVGSAHSAKGEMTVELISSEERGIFYMDIINEWRKQIGRIPDTLSLTLGAMQMGPGGSAVELQLRGADFERLKEIRSILREKMSHYDFVEDVDDNFRPGKLEARLKLKPLARALGFRNQDIALQVRQSFFGDEALRIQRGRDDIRVYVRYPKAARDTLRTLRTLRIRNAQGQELPFDQVAEFAFTRGFTTINHALRQKQITLLADIDNRRANDNMFRTAFERDVLKEMRLKYPDVKMEFRGRAKDMGDSISSLMRGLIMALLVIYAILATIFGAYIQPLIIMMAIPLGFIGAVIGHMMMGFDLTMLSLFGVVALAGMVVNNSLLLIEFINRRRAEGETDLHKACINACRERFMAIFLTSSTTFLGLTPMLLEKSRQAVFLQPMVVSLGFGIVFATVLTLFIIPALYLILEDVLGLLRRLLPAPPADENRKRA